MPGPKYSVIVPAYNSAATIERCLDALMKQDMDKALYEVVVVDDGSSDNTAELIKRYDVRYIHQQNQGPATARNHGARESSGEIILFTDSDCVAEPQWLPRMTAPFEQGNVMGVKGAYASGHPTLTARFCQVEFEERFKLLREAECIDMVDTYAAAFRRDVFEAAGGFDTSFPSANNEDTDLSYKLCALGHRLVFAPEARVFHLGHPDTPRKYARQKFWRGYWRMVVYGRYPEKAVKDTYTPKTLKIQVMLSLCMAGLLVLSLFWTPLAFVFVLAGLVFTFTTLPFVSLAAEHDPPVALTSPFFLLIRGLSIGMGALYYFLNKPDMKGRSTGK